MVTNTNLEGHLLLTFKVAFKLYNLFPLKIAK